MHLILCLLGIFFNVGVSAAEGLKPTSHKTVEDITKEVLTPGYKPPKAPWWK